MRGKRLHFLAVDQKDVRTLVGIDLSNVEGPSKDQARIEDSPEIAFPAKSCKKFWPEISADKSKTFLASQQPALALNPKDLSWEHCGAVERMESGLVPGGGLAGSPL